MVRDISFMAQRLLNLRSISSQSEISLRRASTIKLAFRKLNLISLNAGSYPGGCQRVPTSCLYLVSRRTQLIDAALPAAARRRRPLELRVALRYKESAFTEVLLSIRAAQFIKARAFSAMVFMLLGLAPALAVV